MSSLEKEKPTIIITDPSEEQLALFAEKSPNELIRFLTAFDRPTAQLLIADKKNFVAGVVVNSKICEPFGIPLIRFSKQHRPATPVYLSIDEKEPEPEQAVIKGLQIAAILRKPLDRQDVSSKVFPYAYFDITRAQELSKNDTSPLDANITAEDDKMHPILAKDFLCGSKSFFDVYVRLGSGRYIKLLKSGDAFDAERVREYLAKGVTHFYIKSEAQEVFLQYCDSLTGIILHKKEVPIDLKVNQVMNFGKETTDFLNQRGFNESTLLSAKQFVSHSSFLVKQLKPERSPVLRSFLANIALCEHGAAVTMIVGLMLETLKFADEKIINTLALASFMHDIGLVNMPAKFADEDEELLNEEEFKQFFTHPMVGFELSRSIRMINPIVPSTILEHHERRTARGFPYGRGAGMISQTAELVGIADMFVQLLKKEAKTPGFSAYEKMQSIASNQFSFTVVEAFNKTFPKPAVVATAKT